MVNMKYLLHLKKMKVPRRENEYIFTSLNMNRFTVISLVIIIFTQVIIIWILHSDNKDIQSIKDNIDIMSTNIYDINRILNEEIEFEFVIE